MLALLHACLAWAGTKETLQTLAEMCLLEQDMMCQTVWMACSEVSTVIVLSGHKDSAGFGASSGWSFSLCIHKGARTLQLAVWHIGFMSESMRFALRIRNTKLLLEGLLTALVLAGPDHITCITPTQHWTQRWLCGSSIHSQTG